MINFSPYKTFFSDGVLRRIVLSSILPRMPAGMNALALTMLVQSKTQSFAAAGSVTAAYMIAAALQAPIIGRLIDNRGPRHVMLPMGMACALALCLVVLAAHLQWPLIAIMIGAFLAGGSFPPVSMTIRAMYRKSSMSDAQKQTAFAIEAIVMELAFTLGPLAVTTALLTGHAATAVLSSAVFVGIGTWLFSRSGALERWGSVEVGAHVVRHWLGPLKISSIRRALILSAMFGIAIGLFEISLPAFAKYVSNDALVGWLFAALSLPSAIAGFVYGTLRVTMPLNKQILMCAGWLTVGAAIMAATNAFPAYTLMCVLTGIAFGPMVTALSLQLGKLTPVEYSTEAFTWSMTVFLSGMGIGFPLGGALIEASHWLDGWRASLLLSAVAFAIVGLTCLAVPEVKNDEVATS